MAGRGNFALGCPDWVCYFSGAPLTTGWWDPDVCHESYVNVNNLSHDSWPLCFLTPHLVPINIYLCSLVIFVRVLTTKVTESCSFKSWFILGLTMRTAMLGLDTLPPCRWLTFMFLDRCQWQLGRQWLNHNLSFLVAQQQYSLVTFLVLSH
jgi:hypothetical protein